MDRLEQRGLRRGKEKGKRKVVVWGKKPRTVITAIACGGKKQEKGIFIGEKKKGNFLLLPHGGKKKKKIPVYLPFEKGEGQRISCRCGKKTKITLRRARRKAGGPVIWRKKGKGGERKTVSFYDHFLVKKEKDKEVMITGKRSRRGGGKREKHQKKGKKEKGKKKGDQQQLQKTPAPAAKNAQNH